MSVIISKTPYSVTFSAGVPCAFVVCMSEWFLCDTCVIFNCTPVLVDIVCQCQSCMSRDDSQASQSAMCHCH